MAYEFRLPDMGEGLTEAEVVRWLVERGEVVSVDQPLVEVETDKALVEIPAPRAGILLRRGAEVGATVEVGQVLAVIGSAEEDGEPKEDAPVVGTLEEAPDAPPRPDTTRRPPPSPRAQVQALPLVRKLARELGVDLTEVEGSGPGGRVTREDVEAAAGGPGVPAADGERVSLSRLRKTIADNLTRSWKEIPHVTTFGEADAGSLLSAKAAMAEREGAPFPLEALVIKAVIPALKFHPEFNASLEGDDLVLRKRYDIGVAVDTPEGLILPVVKGADGMNLPEVATEIVRLAEAARSRKLTPDDVSRLTFTVSNIGAVGGGYGTPIIPYGTTAILSVGRAEDRPVVRDGTVSVAPLFPLSLSFDHRVIDGALGRRFLAAVIEHLEEPALFLT